ncbi:hypothetical protein QUF90_13445 [Desulfococcaceae bacterium HSG9]|nr:hypothetical protein [Desulfococcaceae bacterium HSG9]
MKIISSIIFTGIILFSINATAAQVPTGTWEQTSSTAGDCSNCEIKIVKMTPHIIQITSNNEWIGYAYYNQSSDSYKGAFEWKAGKGGSYNNHVFLINLVYEGKTLTMKANGTKLNFSVTYRKK